MSKDKIGKLDLITGCMCCGKSTELLRRLHRATAANLKVLYINHISDTRSKGPYSTHNPLYKEQLSKQTHIDFVSLKYLKDIQNIEKYDIIGIDEGQFFPHLFEMVLELVEVKNKHVIVAGLTNDFKRKKFGLMLDLEPYSNTFTKLTAFCRNCAKNNKQTNAIFSHRISKNKEQISVGGTDEYIPLCRGCYIQLNNSYV